MNRIAKNIFLILLFLLFTVPSVVAGKYEPFPKNATYNDLGKIAWEETSSHGNYQATGKDIDFDTNGHFYIVWNTADWDWLTDVEIYRVEIIPKERSSSGKTEEGPEKFVGYEYFGRTPHSRAGKAWYYVKDQKPGRYYYKIKVRNNGTLNVKSAASGIAPVYLLQLSSSGQKKHTYYYELRTGGIIVPEKPGKPLIVKHTTSKGDQYYLPFGLVPFADGYAICRGDTDEYVPKEGAPYSNAIDQYGMMVTFVPATVKSAFEINKLNDVYDRYRIVAHYSDFGKEGKSVDHWGPASDPVYFKLTPEATIAYADGWQNSIDLYVNVAWMEASDDLCGFNEDLEYSSKKISDDGERVGGWTGFRNVDSKQMSGRRFNDGADGYAYRFKYRIKNRGGQWSEKSFPGTELMLDLTSPSVPADFKANRAAINSGKIVFTWKASTDKKPGSGVDHYLLKIEPPIQINGGDKKTFDRDVTLTLHSADAKKMRFSNSASANWTNWEDYKETKYWQLKAGNAVKEVFVQYKDENGETSEKNSDKIELDSDSKVIINDGDEITNSPKVTLTLRDPGAKFMRFKESSGGHWTKWEQYKPDRDYSLKDSAERVERTVQVQFTTDTNGKDGMPSAHPDIVSAHADITLDKSADPYAGGKSRDLLWKTDGQDNEKILWVNKNEGEVNYRQEGQYAAKIRAVDKAGNRSNWSDPVKFIVDRRLPKVKKVTSTAQSDKIFKAGDKIDITLEFDKPMFVGGDPRLYLNATGRYAVYDSGHGTNKLKFIYTVQKNDKADPLDYANKMALKDKDHRTDTGITADIVDKAGNKIAELPLSGNKGILAAEKIKVDAVAPVGETMSVKINDDAVKTRQRRVTLKLDRGSANTDVNKMRVRNAGRNWEEWSNYQSTLSDFVLAPGDDGVRNVEAQFKDAAGNISEVVSDDIILDTTGPTGKIEIKVYKSVDTYASGEVTRNKNVKISLVGLSADAKMVKAAGDIAEPNPYKDYVNRPGDNALFVDLTDGSGEKKITVSASDELGNKTDFTDTVTLDLDPPDGPVGLKVTPEGWTSKASWTVTWESAAPDVASAWYSVDGKKAEPAEIAAQSFTITGLDEGDHEVKVWLEDAAGNADPNKYGTVHLKLDQTDPTNPSSPCQGYEIQGGASISDLYSAGYTSRNPYFVWSDANDFDASGRTGSGIKGYYVYFGTDEYPDPVRDGVFQTANNYTAPGNLINGQTYRLVVRTVDNADRLAGGKIRLFSYKYVGETNAPTITVDKASFDLTVQQGQTLSPNPVFMVGNSGNASLNYTVSVPATDTWLTLVPPASRTIPAGSTGQITEQFVVSAVNLTQPTYTTTITITDNFATNSPVMIPVTLQVVAASTTHTFNLVPGVNWISIPAENPTANGVNIIDQATLWQSLDLKDNDLIEKPEAGKSSYTSYFEDSALGRIGTNYPVNPGDCYRVTIATPPANGWTVSGKRRASESFSLVKGINWIYLPLSKASIAQAAGLWSAQGGLGLGAGELLEKPEPGKSSYTYYFVDPDLGAQGNNFSVAVYECYRVTITNPKTWP